MGYFTPQAIFHRLFGFNLKLAMYMNILVRPIQICVSVVYKHLALVDDYDTLVDHFI